ncbi:UNKNOWN [Stylonychia lemnae]|uniref:Uncharacterized protein n=1 Tax=Stylonychia lemnae TaxID=5949 RepID=A0A078AYH9_STYLE|nr:UNKNOWN [Stylonychia lemnae]|eukprot:CDW87470.1 UNKNOWN [Stylonychia lemnae]
MLSKKISSITLILSIFVFSMNSALLQAQSFDYASAQICVFDERSNYLAECYLQDYPHSVEITINRKKYTCLCDWMDDANMKKKISDAKEEESAAQSVSQSSPVNKKRVESSTIAKLMQKVQ